MNRDELVSSMNQATSVLMKEKGYISFADILIQMGKLSKADYESWRMRKVPYLERVIRLNLNQLGHLQHTLRQNAARGRLKPSKTVYLSWGKGPKHPLRFSKTGHPKIEEAYATHFVKRRPDAEDTASDGATRTEDSAKSYDRGHDLADEAIVG